MTNGESPELHCALCGAPVAWSGQDVLAGRAIRCPQGHLIDPRRVMPGMAEAARFWRDLAQAVERVRRGRSDSARR